MADKPDVLYKIRQLTTSLGIYQFGILDKPDPSFGYALDDQARALIVADEFGEENLKKIYLKYIVRSQRPDGFLYQFCDKDGNFFDNTSAEATSASQDAYGETLWALFKTKNNYLPEIEPIVSQLIKSAQDWAYLRPMAEALLGSTSAKTQFPLEEKFTESLLRAYEENSDENWDWTEDKLTYANPVLPWSLWQVVIKKGTEEIKEIAQKMTYFLLEICQIDGVPFPIGNKGWYQKGTQKSVYDQQPIDAGYMVCCLEKAYEATKDEFYLSWAQKWWNWFWGENTGRVPLVDENFACYDGLGPRGVNPNQGAESSICFLMAYLAAQRMGLTHI